MLPKTGLDLQPMRSTWIGMAKKHIRIPRGSRCHVGMVYDLAEADVEVRKSTKHSVPDPTLTADESHCR